MLKLILKFLSILPLRLNHFLGTLLGRSLYLFNTKSKNMVAKNIELCFKDLPKKQQQALIKKSLIEMGKGLTESGFIWFKDFKTNTKYVTKTNGLDLLKTSKPVILLVPHFGTWELTGRVLSLSRPITFLYRELRDKKQEKLLFSKRQQGDITMATADKKGVIKLSRVLSKNGIIGILPDQDPGEEGSILAPFFGVDVGTMTLLVKLARKNNAKVIMTWAQRLEKGRGYELNLKSINVFSKSESLKDDVTLMNSEIESLVKTKPEQYLWSYKRFKSVIKY